MDAAPPLPRSPVPVPVQAPHTVAPPPTLGAAGVSQRSDRGHGRDRRSPTPDIDSRVRSARILAVAAFAAAAASLPAGAQAPVREVSLREAIELSLATDPRMTASEGLVADARAGVMTATGAYLPGLTLGSTYGNSSNERLDPNSGNRVSESYTAQAQMSYELFSGGRRLADRRAAGARLAAAETGVMGQRYAVTLETTQAFYAAAAAEEVLQVARQRDARARQQLSFAETRLEVGSATRSDVLRAELEVGNARTAVIEAETAVRTGRLALGRRVGLAEPVRPAATQLPRIAPPLPTDARLETLAVANSPTVRSANAEARVGAAVRRASYAAYLPSLRATAGYDWFSFDFPPEQRSWSVRVIASLPVFNGFQREGTIARAASAERTAVARASAAEVAARTEAAIVAEEVRGAEERTALALRAVELAREDLGVQEERYQLGASTILDLLTSQVALAEAEVAAVRARQSLATALARLETVVGVPLEQLQ
jgi:outer membrane protein